MYTTLLESTTIGRSMARSNCAPAIAGVSLLKALSLGNLPKGIPYCRNLSLYVVLGFLSLKWRVAAFLVLLACGGEIPGCNMQDREKTDLYFV